MQYVFIYSWSLNLHNLQYGIPNLMCEILSEAVGLGKYLRCNKSGSYSINYMSYLAISLELLRTGLPTCLGI